MKKLVGILAGLVLLTSAALAYEPFDEQWVFESQPATATACGCRAEKTAARSCCETDAHPTSRCYHRSYSSPAAEFDPTASLYNWN
jgi:hypothetical protein